MGYDNVMAYENPSDMKAHHIIPELINDGHCVSKSTQPGYDIHSLPWEAMVLIEIDALPSYKMGGSFHGELLYSHNQINLRHLFSAAPISAKCTCTDMYRALSSSTI